MRSIQIWRSSLRSSTWTTRTALTLAPAQRLHEGTLTFGYMPAKKFELRLEARYDTYKPDSGGSSNATQAWLQALYKF